MMYRNVVHIFIHSLENILSQRIFAAIYIIII